jgi:hypothetical protein
MCHVCASACRGELPQGGVVSPLKSLVLVIGRAHLEGLLFLLDSRKKDTLVGRGHERGLRNQTAQFLRFALYVGGTALGGLYIKPRASIQ